VCLKFLATQTLSNVKVRVTCCTVAEYQNKIPSQFLFLNSIRQVRIFSFQRCSFIETEANLAISTAFSKVALIQIQGSASPVFIRERFVACGHIPIETPVVSQQLQQQRDPFWGFLKTRQKF